MPFSLADAIFWIAVACCAIAQVAILHSVFVSPTSRGGRATDETTVAPTARRALEIAWAVLPGIALGVVLVFTWRAIHSAPSPASGSSDSIVASSIR